MIISHFESKLPTKFLRQETRRLVVSSLQHITYTEWLPVILGEHMATQLGITSDMSEYKPKVDPSILNSFSTAAFRFK